MKIKCYYPAREGNGDARYLVYPSLLDAFQDYLDCAEVWERYWGQSETPKKSYKDYHAECLQRLLDKINRVPLADTYAADKGTCLNVIIDNLVSLEDTNPKVSIIEPTEGSPMWRAALNGHYYEYPDELVQTLHERFDGCGIQVYDEGTIETRFGKVLLYGFTDYTAFDTLHDLKVTGSYESGRFANKWQRYVYPYVSWVNGFETKEFIYDVVELPKEGGYSIFEEVYPYDHSEATIRLMNFLETFIAFLEMHRDSITDKRIFNEPTILEVANG